MDRTASGERKNNPIQSKMPGNDFAGKTGSRKENNFKVLPSSRLPGYLPTTSNVLKDPNRRGEFKKIRPLKSVAKKFPMRGRLDSNVDHIQNFSNFQEEQFHFTKEECKSVSEYFQLEPFAKNEYFVSQGKVCRKLAFIAEGVMRYCMFRDDGTDVTCFFMCEKDFVGDVDSFYSQKPSDKNLQALTDCQLITISFDNMQKLLQNVPRGKEINAAIGHYVTMRMLHQRTFLLNLDAAVRYKEFMREYPHVLQRIPLSFVANFLGIAQQSLSRLRKNIPVVPDRKA